MAEEAAGVAPAMGRAQGHAAVGRVAGDEVAVGQGRLVEGVGDLDHLREWAGADEPGQGDFDGVLSDTRGAGVQLQAGQSGGHLGDHQTRITAAHGAAHPHGGLDEKGAAAGRRVENAGRRVDDLVDPSSGARASSPLFGRRQGRADKPRATDVAASRGSVQQPL